MIDNIRSGRKIRCYGALGEGAFSVEIEVFDKQEGLHGGPEVWVRVMCNEVADWPTILRKIGGQARLEETLKMPRLKQHYPHFPSPDERLEHGFTMEEWWIVGEHK